MRITDKQRLDWLISQCNTSVLPSGIDLRGNWEDDFYQLFIKAIDSEIRASKKRAAIGREKTK